MTPSFTRLNYKSTAGLNKFKVEKRILEEVGKSNYIRTKTCPNNVSALGAIPKDVDDVRIIHDLSKPDGGINCLAWDTSVVYTSIDKVTSKIKASSYLAKVDLKAAYRSIPIHKDCYKLTGIKWKFDGDQCSTYLFDAKLPFGAAKSCRIFQTVTDSICRIMLKSGFVVESYIDDFICIGDDELSCLTCYNALIELIQMLGLDVNFPKVCEPTRVLTFLGVVINCDQRTLSLPECKLIELKKLVAGFITKKKVTKLELQKILGKLNWASRVIKGGRSFMRRLIDLSCVPKQPYHFVRLGSEAKLDLSWWIKGLALFHGSCGFKCDLPLPRFCFATDACPTGGGGFLGTDWFYVNWELDCPELVGSHINELELATVFIALSRWGSKLSGTHVRIRSDNMATVSALNKSTTRGPALMPWVREIFWLCVRYDITITSRHIPGIENILADRVSRLDSIREAMDARVILANFTGNLVFCNSHMTYLSFVSLQAKWIRDLLY